MGSDANVATGWHAVEFLLWGQDLNGTGPGRRQPALDRLFHDRTAPTAIATGAPPTSRSRPTSWSRTSPTWRRGGRRAARPAPSSRARATRRAWPSILTGLGSLSFGELAGERIKLGLVLHDPEEEHDCFSDDTHHSYLNRERGIVSVWTASYKRRDGSVVEGPASTSLPPKRTPRRPARSTSA